MILSQCPPFHVPRAVPRHHVYRPGGYSRGVPPCLKEQFEALQCFQDHRCQVVNHRVPRAVVRRRQRQCEERRCWGRPWPVQGDAKQIMLDYGDYFTILLTGISGIFVNNLPLSS